MSSIDLSDLAAPRGGSRPLRGYVARPPGAGPWPGVVVIHEVYGLDDVTRRHADRLAAAGYLTLAVDLFSAGGVLRCLVTTMRTAMSGHGRALADIDAARHWLAQSPDCTARIGVVGFCLGGGFALLTAASGFYAAVDNYGHLPHDLEAVLAGACPIMASYGGRDRTIRHAAPKLEETLTRLGVIHDVEEYPTAGHSFLNDVEIGPRLLLPLIRVAGVGPDPVAAADAWRRIEEFLATYLN